MKITLKTFSNESNELFEVEKAVAMEMTTVKNFFDECSNDSSASNKPIVVPVPNVSSSSLILIISYIKKYLELNSNPTDFDNNIKAYNAKFLEKLSIEELRDLILASNYLEIKYLLDLLMQATADFIKNKSVEFVRKFFGIENDFTPEEEAKLRQENAWAFEGVDAD